MSPDEDERRRVALQNAQSVLRERTRIEDELRSAKHDLETAAEEIRKRSEWLRITLASIGDAVITTDEEGRVASLNPVAETLTGWPPGEALGLPVEQVFVIVNEESRQPVTNSALRSLQDGRIVSLTNHTLLIARDGSEHAIDDRAAPIRDENGTILGAVLIFRDVTEQRRADYARRHLAAVVAHSDDAIITKDLNGIITTWNEGARRIFGYTAEEIVGRSITTLIPAEKLSEEDDILAHLRRGEQVQPFETTRIDKSGRRLQMSITASPIKDSQGRIIGASKIGRDITLRTRREQMNRFLSESSAALADLSDYESTLRKLAHLAVPGFADLCAVDIQRDDESVHRLALIQRNAALDALTEEILQTHPPLATDQYGAMRVLRSGESVWHRVVSDDFLRKIAQSERHLDWLRLLRPRSYMCVPVRSQRSAVGALTFVTTESGREYDEMDLRVAEDLAHRAAIAIENATLVSTLKDADRRKDEFLAMLAHELRNPLAPIRNAAHIVRARAPQTPELTWATQVIERQVHQMTRLVDDLLDVSRINSGKIRLHPERITMESVIDDVVETSQPQISGQGHRLEVMKPGEPTYVNADPVRLGQILFNLLDNAAKYTERGGQISLVLTADAEWAEVRVSDTGVGIAKEMLTRIFEMFTQLDRSLDRTQGGLGIGLMLVRRLVEMHGGTVYALSEGAGRGSEFVVRLPRAQG